MTDHESLQSYIARMQSTGLKEHELREIDRRWKRLRKLAQNPATMMGWKY